MSAVLAAILAQIWPYLAGGLAILAGLWGYGRNKKQQGRMEAQAQHDAEAREHRKLEDEIITRGNRARHQPVAPDSLRDDDGERRD